MTISKSSRIESIDILRGLVMILMALDHVRDYFHLNAFYSVDPEDIDTTTPILFFTRFITHYCAPVFIFLAGTSASLYGQKKSKKNVSKFLITRGLWLVFVEIVIMNFLWWFDLTFSFINLQVIWAIGICMIVLGLLIHLPKKLILILGLLIVFGHNLLDVIDIKDNNTGSIFWYILHHKSYLLLGENRFMAFTYPVLSWIGAISLGYCFGDFYKNNTDEIRRKKWLLYLGIGSICLFFILRTFNIYGNSYHWSVQDTISKSFISFFKLIKYPPSLLYLLITLGPAFLFLLFIENIKNRITDFLRVFGRVPFFYYVVHVFVIHVLAILGLIIHSKDWKLMIITKDTLFKGELAGYGYNLFVVYLVWIFIIIILYPICNKYMKYKTNNKDKWWLSYL